MEVHKAIAAAPDSRNVFDGNVFVGQQAQRTDAAQLTKSLLLSRGATINAKPNLQIIADDVASLREGKSDPTNTTLIGRRKPCRSPAKVADCSTHWLPGVGYRAQTSCRSLSL